VSTAEASDAELPREVADGNEAALRLLFERHASWLLLRLRRRTCDQDLVPRGGGRRRVAVGDRHPAAGHAPASPPASLVNVAGDLLSDIAMTTGDDNDRAVARGCRGDRGSDATGAPAHQDDLAVERGVVEFNSSVDAPGRC
jgi:hypothetical protein